jgi:V-type H+-transporting ATPase subunit a
MKMAVIIGVCHMTFGLFLQAANHISRRDMVGLFFEFLPQLAFLMCTFGYMIGIVIYKWCVLWPHEALAPNLIQTMIQVGSLISSHVVFKCLFLLFLAFAHVSNLIEMIIQNVHFRSVVLSCSHLLCHPICASLPFA